MKEDVNNEFIRIDSINYNGYLALEDVVAFSFAHPGAMGIPGNIIVVSKDKKVYTLNYCYDIVIDKVYLVLPILKDVDFGYFEAQVPDGWFSKYMGAGNFLVASKSIEDAFEQRTKDFTHGSEYYVNWLQCVMDIIKE